MSDLETCHFKPCLQLWHRDGQVYRNSSQTGHLHPLVLPAWEMWLCLLRVTEEALHVLGHSQLWVTGWSRRPRRSSPWNTEEGRAWFPVSRHDFASWLQHFLTMTSCTPPCTPTQASSCVQEVGVLGYNTRLYPDTSHLFFICKMGAGNNTIHQSISGGCVKLHVGKGFETFLLISDNKTHGIKTTRDAQPQPNKIRRVN